MRALSSKQAHRHTGDMGVASVLIVEDDVFARTLIAATLVAAKLEVIHATAHAADALATARKQRVDVAVLDLDLGPGPTGFELALVLRREFPTIGLVFLTTYKDPRLLGVRQGLIPPGARFLQKSDLSSPGPLVAAIISAKKTPCAPQSHRFEVESTLTDKQLRVLRMVAEGRSTRDIAEEMGVSDKAVEASISRVHRALGGDSGTTPGTRVSLVRAFYAIAGRTPPRG
jgi:DNA-binding NarL/FixJ family response regulator